MPLLRLASLLLALLPAAAALAGPTTIRVAAEGEAEVSPRLFGQFLEIASWGELGPEAYADEEDGELPGSVVEKLRELHAPVIRFPAGSDLPNLLWTDRIRMPGREEQPDSGGRNDAGLPNHFTYDNFLRLCEELGSEPLIVVKATPGVVAAADLPTRENRRGDGGTLEETAQQAADLVAYLNAELTPGVDPRVQRFAALRAANGRLEPWGVKTFQVGNELFAAMKNDVGEAIWEGLSPEEKAERAGRVSGALADIADAMRAVDPSIELVVDGEFWDPEANRLIVSDPRMREHFRWITNHKYGPWKTDTLVLDGRETDGLDLDAETLHWFCVWFPAGVRPDGRSVGLDDWVFELAADTGYEVSSTEWNWNGWGGFDRPHPRVTAHARALGAAGFLHDLIRRAGSGPGAVTLATQSMMLGETWPLSSVRGDPTDPDGVYLTPTGRATALYSEFHGGQRRAVTIEDPPAPKKLDLQRKGEVIGPEIPPLDVVATAGGGRVFVHAVNRGFTEWVPVRLVLGGVDPSAVASVTHRVLLPDDDESQRMAVTKVRTRELPAEAVSAEGGAALELELPAASVSVIEVGLR